MKTPRQIAHAKFLRSKEWAAIRNDITTVRGNKCEICGKSGLLNVHHLNYDRVGGDEEPDDLIVLCRKCHALEHGLIKVKKKRKRSKSKADKKLAGFARHRGRVRKSREPFLSVVVTSVETVADYEARGGTITKIPPQ